MTAPNTPNLSEIALRLCLSTAPVPGHAPLLDALEKESGYAFAPRLSRGGWYRPGRVLDAEGEEIAEDAMHWLEENWLEQGEDGSAFADHFADSGYMLTRFLGVSHYLVSPYEGTGTGFLQLEIEEIQEVLSHPLTNPDDPADTIEQLVTPPAGARAQALGGPRYLFRRLTDARAFLDQISGQIGKPASILRFVSDWEASSSGQQTRFCDHWVLALNEFLDRYKQTQRSASPVAALAPPWGGNAAARGMDLARELHTYDRQAGYGFSWFFHMVNGHKVPRSLTASVFADIQDGLAYLPERDAALVCRWMEEPYAL